MRILYLGWVGANNVGDELMLENFKALAYKKFGPKCRVTGIFPSEAYNNFAIYDMVVLGGGSVLLEGFINIMYRALEQGKRIMIWGTGYDELLGEKFINRIENSYISPYIYSDATEVKLNEIAKKADFFGVRGPLTYKILEKSNVDMSKVFISGDVGFLLEGEELDMAGTNLDFTKEDKVVAVNVGTSNNRIYGQREDVVIESVTRACNKLIKQGYKIYLYSVWTRDLDYSLQVYQRLEPSSEVILDLVIHSGSELVTIMQNCIFSINFKLHGNVISAVAGTPFICLGYRLKAYDLLKSIDCEDLNISTDKENLEEEILNKVLYIQENSEAIIEKMANNIEKYKQIQLKTFDE